MTTSRLAEFLWVSAQTTKGDGLPEGNQLLKYPLSAAGFSLIPNDMGLGMMCVSSYTHACHKQVRPYMYSTMMRIILSNQRLFQHIGRKSHGTWRSWLTTLGSRLWIGSIYIRGQAWAGPRFPISNHCQCPPEKNPHVRWHFESWAFTSKCRECDCRIWKLESNTGLTFTLDKHSWMLVILLHLSLASLNHWITKN